MLPGTFGVAARFAADRGRLASIPTSSETGETGTVWQRDGRSIDRHGLPVGILLRPGGAADRLMPDAAGPCTRRLQSPATISQLWWTACRARGCGWRWIM